MVFLLLLQKNTVVTSENARRKRKRKMVGINYHHYHHHKKTADKQVKRQRRQRTGDRQTLKEHTFLQDTHTHFNLLFHFEDENLSFSFSILKDSSVKREEIVEKRN